MILTNIDNLVILEEFIERGKITNGTLFEN
jgi:hypothetical protein